MLVSKLSLLALTSVASAFAGIDHASFGPYKRQLFPSGYVDSSSADKDVTTSSFNKDATSTSSVDKDAASTKDMVTTSVVKIDVYPTISPSFVLSTSYVTVFTCPESVTDCPLRSKAPTLTSVVVVSTSLCPVTYTSSSISHIVSSAPVSYLPPPAVASLTTPASTIVVTHETQSYTPGTTTASSITPNVVSSSAQSPSKLPSAPTSSSETSPSLTSNGTAAVTTQMPSSSSSSASVPFSSPSASAALQNTSLPANTETISYPSASIPATSQTSALQANSTAPSTSQTPVSFSSIAPSVSNATGIGSVPSPSNGISTPGEASVMSSSTLASLGNSSSSTSSAPVIAITPSSEQSTAPVSSAGPSSVASFGNYSASIGSTGSASTSFYLGPGYTTVSSGAPSATPVFAPSMLGGAYGGGISPQPSIYVSPISNVSVNTQVPPAYGFTVMYSGSSAVTGPASASTISPSGINVPASYTVIYGGSSTSILAVTPVGPVPSSASGSAGSGTSSIAIPGEVPSAHTIVVPPGTTLTTAIPVASIVPNLPGAGESTQQNPAGPVYGTSESSTYTFIGQASSTSTTVILPAGSTPASPGVTSFSITVGGTPRVIQATVTPSPSPPFNSISNAAGSPSGSFNVIAGSITTQVPAFDTSSLASQLSSLSAASYPPGASPLSATSPASTAAPNEGPSTPIASGEAPSSLVTGSAAQIGGSVSGTEIPASSAPLSALPSAGPSVSGVPAPGSASVAPSPGAGQSLASVGGSTVPMPGSGAGTAGVSVSTGSAAPSSPAVSGLPTPSLASSSSSGPSPPITLPAGVPSAPAGSGVTIIPESGSTTFVIPPGSYTTAPVGQSAGSEVGSGSGSGGTGIESSPSTSLANFGNGTTLGSSPVPTPSQYRGSAAHTAAEILHVLTGVVAALITLV